MTESNSTLNIWVKLRDEAKKPLEGLGANIKALEPQFKKIAVVSGAAFTAIAAGVSLSVKAYVSAGDALNDMAERTGFSAQALSELKFAAELSGTSIEAIEISSRMMAGTLVEAARGSNEANKSLAALGLTVRDFSGLSPEQAFIKMASAVADIENPMLKSRLAMEVFGRQGTQLLPLLADGSKGLDLMRQKANELGVTFNDEAAEAAAQFDDSLGELKNSFSGLQYSIASAVLPALNKFLNIVTPIIASVSNFIREHKELTAVFIGSVAGILGVVAGLASLAIVVPKVIAGLKLLNISLAASAGPIGVVLLGLSGVAALIGVLEKASKNGAASVDTLDTNITELTESMNNSLEDIQATGGAFQDLAKEAEDTAKKIKDVEKNISDLIKENSNQQQSYKENLAQAFIDQEDKVADLTKQIQEEKNQKLSADQSVADMEALAQLESQLLSEQAALDRMKIYREGISNELVEMRRRAELSEFELRVENLMRQRLAELKAFSEKLELQLQEREELKKHLADLAAQQEGYTKKIQDEEKKRLDAVVVTTTAINDSMRQRLQSMSMTSGATTVPFASSGKNSMLYTPSSPFSTGAMLGVRDAVITPRGDVIKTDPKDYLIATKNPGALTGQGSGGGVTVIINGDVSGSELVEKVKEALMRGLRFDTKFSI